jgi:hypothetical protein
MNHYRVYTLEAPDRRIVKGKDLHAADDKEAMARAHDDQDCPACEVWRGAKKVGNVE